MEITHEDFVISDSGPLGSMCSLGSQGYGFIGEFDEMSQALTAMKAWANENQYWPNLYYMNDHGNIDQIDYNGNIVEPIEDDEYE